MLTGLVPMHRLDKFDRVQQHLRPAQPRFSGESVVWRNEHAASADATLIEIPAASLSPSPVWSQRLSS
jgi:hypothetical protein